MRCYRAAAIYAAAVLRSTVRLSVCQQQSCKASTGLSNGAQMVYGSRPLIPEILSQIDRPTPLSRQRHVNFRSIFARSVSAVTQRREVQLSLIGSPLRTFQ